MVSRGEDAETGLILPEIKEFVTACLVLKSLRLMLSAFNSIDLPQHTKKNSLGGMLGFPLSRPLQIDCGTADRLKGQRAISAIAPAIALLTDSSHACRQKVEPTAFVTHAPDIFQRALSVVSIPAHRGCNTQR